MVISAWNATILGENLTENSVSKLDTMTNGCDPSTKEVEARGSYARSQAGLHKRPCLTSQGLMMYLSGGVLTSQM